MSGSRVAMLYVWSLFLIYIYLFDDIFSIWRDTWSGITVDKWLDIKRDIIGFCLGETHQNLRIKIRPELNELARFIYHNSQKEHYISNNICFLIAAIKVRHFYKLILLSNLTFKHFLSFHRQRRQQIHYGAEIVGFESKMIL